MLPLFGAGFILAGVIYISHYDGFHGALHTHRHSKSFVTSSVEIGAVCGGQLVDENYKPWRQRWLQWHARSLLASVVALAEAERESYLDRMRAAYCDLGDFPESEIDFIFRRVSRGIRKLGPCPGVLEVSPLTQLRIRAQGLRLMADAYRLIAEEL